jgi:hypothetical protein
MLTVCMHTFHNQMCPSSHQGLHIHTFTHPRPHSDSAPECAFVICPWSTAKRDRGYPSSESHGQCQQFNPCPFFPPSPRSCAKVGLVPGLDLGWWSGLFPSCLSQCSCKEDRDLVLESRTAKHWHHYCPPRGL